MRPWVSSANNPCFWLASTLNSLRSSWMNSMKKSYESFYWAFSNLRKTWGLNPVLGLARLDGLSYCGNPFFLLCLLCVSFPLFWLRPVIVIVGQGLGGHTFLCLGPWVLVLRHNLRPLHLGHVWRKCLCTPHREPGVFLFLPPISRVF